jgi:ribokinase
LEEVILSKIVVAGLINIETTLKVKGFPIEYFSIDYPFYGIGSGVAGVAVNISKVLNTLGDEVKIVSLLGQDEEAERVEKMFDKLGWSREYIKNELSDTPQSIILYDQTGKREIYCDLKDIQEKAFSEELLKEALNDCKIAIVCNTNFARPLLHIAKERNITIASDMHVLSDIHDSYNKEFMEHADILFLSDEKLPCEPEEFIRELKDTYASQIIVMGQGAKGAMMYVRKDEALYHIDAVTTCKVVNTVGAGDALFSSFIHYCMKGESPIEALKRAEIFASYKIGTDGAAKGFVNEEKIEELYRGIDFKVHLYEINR